MGEMIQTVWLENIVKARIPPVVPGAKLRLMFVAGAFVAALFPLIYVALILLVAWALYRFGSASSPDSNVHSPIVSASVLLVGCLLILSMLKPLVARPVPASQPHYLDREKQPLLFALAESLASKIGVAAPERIAVDCNVNCYCMFAGGITGMFRCGFVLVIGLPLVVGLRLDQVVGVLAHELGHALQIATMRSSRVIWAVHSWLSRVVFQQDEFDAILLRRLDTAGNAMRLALRLTRLLVQPARGILWLLMMAEGAVSCKFRRCIEVTADRYQIRVSGTEKFISAVLEINLLTVAAQRAVVELSRMKRRGRLIDDYPGLIACIRARYPKDFVERLLAGLAEERTGLLSAHPCDKDRIALARAEHQQGIVTSDLPASVLFTEYQTLCREVAVEYYEQELGVAAEGCKIVPIDTILNYENDRDH
jgi:Zn-dependent protease with chaperone function